MKNIAKGFLDKLPFNGYKTILGLALHDYVIPFVPEVLSVPFGGVIIPIPSKLIVTGLAGVLTTFGLIHKPLKTND